MTVGQRVKHLRGNKTLKEFSEPLEVTPATISAIETGKLGLSSDLAIRIAKTYKVSLDWLLMGEEKPPKEQEKVSDNNYITISKDELLDLYKRLNRKQEDEIDKLHGQIKVKNINPTSSES